MTEKIKVIQISHASVSVYMHGQKTLRQMILDDWYSLTAQQIKKYHPGIEVECWTPEKKFKTPQEFSHNEIKYRQFPTAFSPIYGLDFSIKMLEEMKREMKRCKKEGVKLIFHLHEYHNVHGLLIAMLFKNVNLVGQHHGGSWPLKHLRQTKKYKLFFPFFVLGQIWENLVLKNIKYFYALSEEEINYLKKVAPKSKVKFQTMGIEDYYYEKIKRDIARKELNWPKDKKIILFLGRLIPSKGIEYLLKAMESLEEMELKIIGWGDEKKYEGLNKLKNVEFLGAFFGKEKLIYLSAADAFVLPSCKEGASVSVMEALARNLPVVTTDTGGMPLMIKTGREGIVIKQRDSNEIVRGIREILSWKNKEVKKYAERYRWKEIIDATLEDYKEMKSN